MHVHQPALLIQAGDDFFLAPDQGDLTAQYASRLERRVVPRAGHWIQQERPDEVNALLIAWLRSLER
jgi:pimeloyl-ACP methyl ester carboxylesterase